VEYAFPGILSVHLASGAVAQCGGPSVGWLVDISRRPEAQVQTVEVDVADDERDPARIADALAKVLKRR
jgi:hypothetical protein